jgi:hypothetical protein
MRPTARLRALDDRVLGRPRPEQVSTARAWCLIALALTLTCLAVVAVTGAWRYASGIGGLLGLTLGTGLRWYRGTHPSRRG